MDVRQEGLNRRIFFFKKKQKGMDYIHAFCFLNTDVLLQIANLRWDRRKPFTNRGHGNPGRPGTRTS